MGKTRSFLIGLGERFDIPPQAADLEPITILTGNREVAVECQNGIRSFSQEEISVSVPDGVITVCGKALGIVLMKQKRIVIRGVIDTVAYQKETGV